MPKAVLTTRVDPTYDDLPEVKYHFPQTYLNAIEGALGDWVVYYEPRRLGGNLSSSGGRQSYFATARLVDVRPDPAKKDHYYAFVKDYLEFDRPVPFREQRVRENPFYYERLLQKPNGSTNRGRFGRAVRFLKDAEYYEILAAGFVNILGKRNRRLGPGAEEFPIRTVPPDEAYGDPTEPEEQHRRIITQISHRPFRDRAFSSVIKSAYENTCAVSGIRIINGGGRPEVQAAHIRPVKRHGPDSVRNGVALCGTMHWMFDRGLISIDDDFSLLFDEKSIPGNVLRMVNRDRRLRLPELQQHYPHRQFLKYHREFVFKG